MEKLAQPLTADERHHANAAIEFASVLVQHARWGIAGFVMIASYAALQLLVFTSGRVLINPIGPMISTSAIAFIASSPVAHAAESIRYRSRRTLLVAIVVVGLCVGLSVLGVIGAVIIDVASALRHDVDGTIINSIVAVFAIAVLGAAAWVLSKFVLALRAIDRLKAKVPQGFAVIANDGNETRTATPPAYKLPPRPKR